ncbi:MAG: hypothetical protein NTY48_02260 [Candidatus Diapherotrites archaeon]|nr:hypothetical protein [Candidatus Diapherotrites archaeon]
MRKLSPLSGMNELHELGFKAIKRWNTAREEHPMGGKKVDIAFQRMKSVNKILAKRKLQILRVKLALTTRKADIEQIQEEIELNERILKD